MDCPIYKAKYPVSVVVNGIKDTIYYRVLSKRELSDIFSLYPTSKYLNMLQVLKVSLSDKEIIDFLSDNEIELLYNEIIEKSTPSETTLNLLNSLFKLQNDNSLQSETWDCEICKERDLQADRACGFLPEDQRSKSFSIYAGGEIHKICPIYKLLQNSTLLNTAYEAYRYYRKGLMPEQGGMYDQTIWFIKLALQMDTLIKQQQADDMKKD